ncbi:MAG: penicillin-binding protein 2 [Burkholderiaceae bacterium]|jgi:cell division protein FtsI (penicillin-binding protein 3)|nr:penicillin-binding protein 2 [Burkholderiaceae bacterium]
MMRMMKFPGNSQPSATQGVSFSDTTSELKIRLSKWRSHIALFFFFLIFMCLIARALWLQVLSTEFLQKQGESRYARTLELPATRGKIMDRNGKVLASSIPVRAIWAIPDDVLSQPKDKLKELARLLNINEKHLYERLDSDRTFVYLKRQVEMNDADAILRLGIKGIQARKEYKRYYPEGEVVSHIVGFTNIEDIGQEGMELASQKTLSGITGSRRVIKDRLGNIVEDIRAVKEPRDGNDLVLSIDSGIQYIAYKQLKDAVTLHKAKAGAVVVLDARTGEVLAMANLPTYNPNDRNQRKGAWLRNRALTDVYEPGSTLKPFTIALGLEKGHITPQTQIQTAPGKMVIGTATIGDSHPHGLLSVSQVLEKSSNVGTAKIALHMQPKDMWEMFTSLGLGMQPEFGFPGTTAGRVRPYKSWRPVEQATISYGHGIAVSLMQVARAYMIFARDGDMEPLSLLRVDQQPASYRVISEKTARTVRGMLEVAAGPMGTAPRAQVPGYRVAGKTGTSKKLEGNEYVKKYVASFVGFAPASNPRVIVAVMIDEPSAGKYYGGDVAAPVFSKIMADTLRAMDVPPDSSVTNIIIPQDGPRESL